MSGSIAFNPFSTTTAAGSFNVTSEGYVQGVFLDDPALRYQLAGGTYLGASQPTLPMIGGAAITTDTNFHYYRISWENQADLAFFVDGNRVNTVGSVIWNPGASNAIFQPWHTVYKPSGTGVATINLDKLDAFNTR